MGLSGVAGLAALFVVMGALLQREFRRKTTELAEEISRREILIDQSRDGIVILDH